MKFQTPDPNYRCNPAQVLGGVAQALQKQKNQQEHLRLVQEKCTAAGNGVGVGSTGTKLLVRVWHGGAQLKLSLTQRGDKIKIFSLIGLVRVQR